ncbi:MAG: branched-chain amino acid transport system ATP-binding protein [Acidimicrobiaceae bacterium]|nr:branched-chain amino acid transport system ATP-binding protein [Acidimicrobiaceae bacterium]
MTATDAGAPRASATRGEPIITVESLALAFGGKQALDNVSFELYPREIVGLIGPNGAGKTALLNCLTGFYVPNSGSIRFGDTDITGQRTGAVARLGISRTFQEAASMGLVGARDLMLLGRERFLPSGVLKYATPWIRRAEFDALQRVRATAREIGILEHVDANTMLDELPYGVRKLADLGRALVCEPSVLLMDEPLAGLHRDEKTLMAALIRRTQEQGSITQVLVDHDLEFVSAICDRLIVLSAGRKVAEGDVEAVLAMEEVVSSYIGVSVDEATDVATEDSREMA